MQTLMYTLPNVTAFCFILWFPLCMANWAGSFWSMDRYSKEPFIQSVCIVTWKKVITKIPIHVRCLLLYFHIRFRKYCAIIKQQRQLSKFERKSNLKINVETAAILSSRKLSWVLPLILPAFSLIRNIGKQNTHGNVSKISVNHTRYRQIGSKSTNHSPLAWCAEGQKVTLVAVLITCRTDGNFGHVSAGVLVCQSRVSTKMVVTREVRMIR